MKLMVEYSIRAGCVPEAVNRFLSGKANPPAGVKLLGRWHKTDSSGGFSLFESDDAAALFEASIAWGDVLEMHDHVVIEDAQAGPLLAKQFTK